MHKIVAIGNYGEMADIEKSISSGQYETVMEKIMEKLKASGKMDLHKQALEKRHTLIKKLSSKQYARAVKKLKIHEEKCFLEETLRIHLTLIANIKKSISSGQYKTAVKGLKVNKENGFHKEALEIHKAFLKKGRHSFDTIELIRKAYKNEGLTKNPWEEIELAPYSLMAIRIVKNY